MSEEEKVEAKDALENVESESETETPLKTPKKKFVMTPGRLENLRKGREKRAENVRKKKEIEAQIKQEEKAKKLAVKQRVEEEMAKDSQTASGDDDSDSESSSDSQTESPPPPPPKTPKKPRKSVPQQAPVRNHVVWFI